ncbi:LysM peptidoglycan-binding domain-containing protein [Reinekea sp. G2M2-21]|uniref:LysM peptidoglycan-binding domain-containing protein n=1 Tax=Reinekea sp. G2M2-21 TaxID=2788942 RepID=UPI0018ABE241|nr:LysM peptidoglycan-binding domain-containing protein [Reinekea sp. G2M2-21]
MNMAVSSIQSIKRSRYYKVLRQPTMDGCDPILLPLGLYDSKPNEEVDGSSESSVRSIQVGIQALNAEEGEIIEGYMPEGWLYVFVNGYLWHEYEVDSHGDFCGIDLRYQQTLDHRSATGVPSKNIVIPTRMEGEDTEVQIAFSHVQWSWRRVLSLGGMNPEDIRYRHWVKNGELLSTIAPKYRFIESYQALSDYNNLASADDIQVGQWLKLRDPDTPHADSDANRSKRMGKPLSEQAKGDELHIAIQDPLGAVDLLNNAMLAIHIQVQALVDEMNGAALDPSGFIMQQVRKETLMQGAPDYVPAEHNAFGIPENATRKDYQQVTQMAQIIYPMLFDEKSFEGLDSDAKSYLEDAKDDISQEDIEGWLHINERKQHREHYRSIQTLLIDYLLDSETPYSECSFYLSVWDCLEDYAWAPVVTYSQLWARTNDLLDLILTDPNNQDYSYDAPTLVKKEREEYGTPGVEVLDALFSPNHPAHEWLFASSDDVDVTSAESITAEVSSEPIESAKMRLGDFQASLKILMSDQEPNANTVVGLMRKPSVGIPDVVDRFLKIITNYNKLHALKSSDLRTIDVDGLFTLYCKSTGMPVLSKVHLIEAGADMKGVIAPGAYRVKNHIRLDAEVELQRAGKRAATKSQYNGNTSHLIDGFDEAGNKIASNTIADLRPYNGPVIDTPEVRWTDVWSNRVANTEGTITYTAKSRMIVTPVTEWTENMSKRLCQWASTKTSLQTAYKGIPSALLFLEVFSLGQALADLNNEKISNVEKSYIVGKHITFVTVAAIEAVEMWKGSDGVIALMKKYSGSLGALGGKEMTMRISSKITLSFPYYKFLGVAVSVIAAIDCGINTFRLAQKHDADAAIAMGISGLMGLSSAGLFFIAANSTAAVAAWIPIWGWILAVGAILAGLIAMWLTDSLFESWAKHCPFSGSTSRRLGHDDYDTIEKLYNGLQNLFFCPSVSLAEREIRENIFEVTVTIQHPSFINHKSTIDWSISASYADISNNRQWGGYRNDKTYTEDDFSRALKSSIVLGDKEQPTGLKLIYHFEMPELNNVITEFIAKHHLFIHFRVRHIIPSGLSLPIDNSDTDDTYGDGEGWVLERLTIVD